MSDIKVFELNMEKKEDVEALEGITWSMYCLQQVMNALVTKNKKKRSRLHSMIEVLVKEATSEDLLNELPSKEEYLEGEFLNENHTWNLYQNIGRSWDLKIPYDLLSNERLYERSKNFVGKQKFVENVWGTSPNLSALRRQEADAAIDFYFVMARDGKEYEEAVNYAWLCSALGYEASFEDVLTFNICMRETFGIEIRDLGRDLDYTFVKCVAKKAGVKFDLSYLGECGGNEVGLCYDWHGYSDSEAQ